MSKISKRMSYLLRHHPEEGPLTLETGGWVEAKALITVLGITSQELEETISSDLKQRFERRRSKVRAAQGHSFPVELGLSAEKPPMFLYHGTTEKALNSIFTSGLLKGERHAVHLSEDLETATAVGSRRGKAVVLKIHSGSMFEEGHIFTRSSNGVWLTETVPPRHIER